LSQNGSLVGDERGTKNIRIIALSSVDPGPVLSSSSGYAIYLEDRKTIADWIDLQVLISQENLGSLHQETRIRLKDSGSAVFKTLEEAENVLSALEKSLI